MISRRGGDLGIADTGSTHTILKSNKYFSELKPTKGTLNTISRLVKLVEGVRKANFILSDCTKLLIDNALFSPKSKRNLLSFLDIYRNGYDTQTNIIGNDKYFHTTNKTYVLEKPPMLHSGLHYAHINLAESHMVIKEKSCHHGILSLWHDRLGHP